MSHVEAAHFCKICCGGAWHSIFRSGQTGEVAEAHVWGRGGNCVDDCVTKDGSDLHLRGQDERLIVDGLDDKVVVPDSVHIVPGSTEEPLHAEDRHPVPQDTRRSSLDLYGCTMLHT